MVNSIRKGKRFEREVAKLLTILTGVKWQRVPQSGAMATMMNLKNRIFAGDVFCEDEPFNTWVVECKITKERITLSDFTSKKSRLWKWIEQLEKETFGAKVLDNSKGNKYIGILFFRDASRNTYMVISSKDVSIINEHLGNAKPFLYFPDDGKYAMFRLKDFK